MNLFLPFLSRKHGGIAALGYHIANPAKFAHNTDISSNNWPRSERVAWKYAEHTPITTNKSHMRWIPDPINLAYGRCKCTRKGGITKNRILDTVLTNSARDKKLNISFSMLTF